MKFSLKIGSGRKIITIIPVHVEFSQVEDSESNIEWAIDFHLHFLEYDRRQFITENSKI